MHNFSYIHFPILFSVQLILAYEMPSGFIKRLIYSGAFSCLPGEQARGITIKPLCA
jgi:hypothetical protein